MAAGLFFLAIYSSAMAATMHFCDRTVSRCRVENSSAVAVEGYFRLCPDSSARRVAAIGARCVLSATGTRPCRVADRGGYHHHSVDRIKSDRYLLESDHARDCREPCDATGAQSSLSPSAKPVVELS